MKHIQKLLKHVNFDLMLAQYPEAHRELEKKYQGFINTDELQLAITCHSPDDENVVYLATIENATYCSEEECHPSITCDGIFLEARGDTLQEAVDGLDQLIASLET